MQLLYNTIDNNEKDTVHLLINTTIFRINCQYELNGFLDTFKISTCKKIYLKSIWKKVWYVI